MVSIRDNWRVVALVVVLVASTFVLFSPTVASDAQGNTVDDPTNLQYGLQLSGGTRIRAPLVGVTAEGVGFDNASRTTVQEAVAAELDGAGLTDVTVRPTGPNAGTVEVTVDGVTPADLGDALSATGYEYDTVREGVTDTTREEVVRVLESKINEAGLSGGTVQQIQTSTGEHYILVEVPNEDRSEVVELVNSRGTVTILAYHPVEENGSTVYRNRTVLTQEDFQDIGAAQEGQGDVPPYVPVVVRDSEAGAFQEDMVQTGLAQSGGTRCSYSDDRTDTDPCLLLVVDGQVVNSFGMSDTLAASLRNGEWADDPRFQLQTRDFSEAQEVGVNLRAGALPAPLDTSGEDGGTSSYISPSQGSDFKRNSLLTGIIAVLAVSGAVFLRYGDTRVALPMVLTALSEVVVLLGFAAGIGYPLDLSVIAGFIAVIGTGVDDLIIIADEVMAEGDVNSNRVFQSRFRKAFWVIGAAAVTTIIAMSPLAVLSLGDLQGFAIFTILGVLVGVLITRPAYGDILRVLLTSDN
jgi:preprotein translocase subunit SecD